MKIKNVITQPAMILSGCGTTSKAAFNFEEYKPVPENEEVTSMGGILLPPYGDIQEYSVFVTISGGRGS